MQTINITELDKYAVDGKLPKAVFIGPSVVTGFIEGQYEFESGSIFTIPVDVYAECKFGKFCKFLAAFNSYAKCTFGSQSIFIGSSKHWMGSKFGTMCQFNDISTFGEECVLGDYSDIKEADIAKNCIIGDWLKLGPNSKVKSGCKIGVNANIGNSCIIGQDLITGDLSDMVEIGDDSIFGESVDLNYVLVGEDSTFGICSRLIHTDIGDGTTFSSFCRLRDCKIGQQCTFGQKTTLNTDNFIHTYDGLKKVNPGKLKCVSSLGKHERTLTYWDTEEGPYFQAGCFLGTEEEFTKAVENKYGLNSDYSKAVEFLLNNKKKV